MNYNKTNWQDHLVNSTTGEVIQVGTPMNAENFNNMENGIEAANDAVGQMETDIDNLSQGSRNVSILNGGGQLTWGVVANTFGWSKVMSIFPAGGKLLRGGVAIRSINIAIGSAVLANANDCMYITIPTTDGATATVAVAQYNAITGNDKIILAVRDMDSCLGLLGSGWLTYGTTVAVGGLRDNYVGKDIITAANDFIVGSGNKAVAKKTLAETKTILGIDSINATLADMLNKIETNKLRMYMGV